MVHGVADRNARPPLNPRATPTATPESPAKGGNTVPQVQFLSSWTVQDCSVFARIPKIIGMTLEKIWPGYFLPSQNQDQIA
jgi:hypothetical protein